MIDNEKNANLSRFGKLYNKVTTTLFSFAVIILFSLISGCGSTTPQKSIPQADYTILSSKYKVFVAREQAVDSPQQSSYYLRFADDCTINQAGLEVISEIRGDIRKICIANCNWQDIHSRVLELAGSLESLEIRNVEFRDSNFPDLSSMQKLTTLELINCDLSANVVRLPKHLGSLSLDASKFSVEDLVDNLSGIQNLDYFSLNFLSLRFKDIECLLQGVKKTSLIKTTSSSSELEKIMNVNPSIVIEVSHKYLGWAESVGKGNQIIPVSERRIKELHSKVYHSTNDNMLWSL